MGRVSDHRTALLVIMPLRLTTSLSIVRAHYLMMKDPFIQLRFFRGAGIVCAAVIVIGALLVRSC